LDNEIRFTAGEAAFVLREPIRAVKKALDSGPVRPTLRHGAGAPVRTIGWSDMFFLFASRALRGDLTPKARGELYHAVRHAQVARGDEVRFGRFRVAVADLVDEMVRRTSGLAELANKVAFREDGEAIFKGGIEVHRIAALLEGGLSVNAVMEDYPSLSRDSVETAQAYAGAWPKAGRPYPRMTANRARRAAEQRDADELREDDDAAG
jgi:uncharacterized protein (DUF433 family)